MAENFTKDQLSEFKEAFALFDVRSVGSVAVEELGTIIRSLGHNPSKKEIDEIVSTLKNEKKREVDFGDFLGVLSKYFASEEDNAVDELKDAFKVFDKKNDGTVNVSELVHILSTLGEQLTEDEVDLMFSEGNMDGNGEINYETFVKLITSE